MTEKTYIFTVDERKDFDIKVSFPCKTVITTNDSDKVKITLVSDKIDNLEDCIKLKTSDTSSRFEIKLKASKDTEAIITLSFPSEFINKVELNGDIDKLSILNIKADNIETNGEISLVEIKNANSHIELNSNADMIISCFDTVGRLDINQFSANSKLDISPDTKFKAENKGRKTQLTVSDDLKQSDDCCLTIELNGMKSNLTIIKA